MKNLCHSNNDDNNSEWRPVVGYEGIYEVSFNGKVRTKDGKTTNNKRFDKRTWKQRTLKPKYSKRKGNKGIKEERVDLWKDGNPKTLLVSRIVAMAWCNGYESGLTVNHIDGDPTNNTASNLEWVSMKKNIQHGYETGLFHTQIGCELVSDTGEPYRFRSLAEASRFLGRNNGYLHMAIKKKRTPKDINDHSYKILRLFKA